MGAMNDFEQHRQHLIARNRARLEALGLADAAEQLATAKPKPKPKAKRQKSKVPQAPTRHSARTAGEAPAALDDEEAQLARMYIDGECPKCGKALEKGIKQHFERCTGPPQRKIRVLGRSSSGDGQGDEEEEEDQKEEQTPIQKLPKPSKKAMAEKLKALELSGLVDFAPEHAKFAVVGSTGSRYTVTLTDAKRTCQCMDHRIRQHDCKHIKLTLQQLGVEKKPSEWRQGVEKQLDAAAAAEAGRGGSGGGEANPLDTAAAAASEEEAEEGDDEPQQKSRKRQQKQAANQQSKRQKMPSAAESQGGGSSSGRQSEAASATAGGRRLPASLG